MRRSGLDLPTKTDIDRRVERVLKDAGFSEPPVDIATVLEILQLDRGFYDLSEPSFVRRIWHRTKIGTHKLREVAESVRLQALLLFDEKRVLLDRALPMPKHDWASAHEAAHQIIPWHGEFCRGDTASTLDPDWHEQIEAEANFAASSLLFCGRVFTLQARETDPCWASVETLRKDHRKSLVTTARRYVTAGPKCPMLLVISTPSWEPKPVDQAGRVRHVVPSPEFESRFPLPDHEALRTAIDSNTWPCRGGPAGELLHSLADRNGSQHIFSAECFFNRYYIITLFVHSEAVTSSSIILPAASSA